MTLLGAGVQSPRICQVPEYESTVAGREAIEFAAEVAGLVLDPWEAYVLEESLGETADGRWAASEVGLVVPRQNGKDAVLEARELAGLFWFKEQLILHSAHHFKTAQEHFRRLTALIEGSAELSRRVKRISRSHGEEGIELLGGQWIRFFARTKGGGRGFGAELVIFNEAMMLPEDALGALLPTQAAMPRRQRWFAGSSVDQYVHEHGVVLARLRERGIRGDDPRLAYFEWSVDAERPDDLEDETLSDEGAWADANPGLGIRITVDAVEDERRSLDRRTFAVERLGVGDWPPTSSTVETVIAIEDWLRLVDRASDLVEVVCLAIDTTPDRAWSSIAAAGLNDDGLPHIEIVEHRRGTGWVARRLADLCERHDVRSVACGGKGAAASLEPECNDLGVVLKMLSASDESRAFGLINDVVSEKRLRHLGSEEIASAVKGATKRRLGDAWAWDRRDAAVDISPLVAATLALWESASFGWEDVGELNIW